MALTESVDEIVENSNHPLLGKHASWARVKLGEIADIQNGFAFKSAKFSKQEGVPLIRIRDVVKDDTETFYTGEYDPEYMVQPGDLLVGMDGDFNCARWRGSPGLLNQRVCRITLKSDVLHPRLIDYALPGYLKAINEKTSSVTVKHLSSKTISEIPLPVPPPEQQELMVAEIEKQFSRLDEAVASLKRVKANLKRYKAAVLKAAVEGKLTEDLPSRQAGWRDSSFRNVSGKLVPTASEKYFAYVLECENGSLYKGCCKNLFARIDQHLTDRGAKWTKEHKPVSLIYFEEYDTEKEAVERETYFKSGSGREWLNEVKEQQNKKYEPASKLLERILAERRTKWEEAELAKMKAKGKSPKDDMWKAKYKKLSPVREDGLPPIPALWVWAKLPMLGELNRGKSKHRPRNYPKLYGGQYPFVQTGDIRQAVGTLTEYTQTYSEHGLKQSRLWQKGTLCITIAANIADTAILGLDACFPDSVVGFVPESDGVNTRFVEYFVRTAKSDLDRFAPATAQKNINLAILNDVAIPLPPKFEQIAIVEAVDQYESIIDVTESAVQDELRKIGRCRQSILIQAFSGRLRFGYRNAA